MTDKDDHWTGLGLD